MIATSLRTARGFIAALTVVLLAPMALMPAPARAQAGASVPAVLNPAQTIPLSIGRGQLVAVSGTMTDVFVANESVADVQIKSQHEFYLLAKAGGQTTVYASDAGGKVVWAANVVVGSNLDSVDQMLRLAMPEAQIGVATMGSGTVLLTGTVASPEDAAEAERLVSAFIGKDANVISRLRTATPLQVNLQVRIAEVSRSLLREIGTNITTRDDTSGFKFGVSRGRDAATIGAGATSGFPMVDASSLYGLPAGSLQLPFDPAKGRFITGKGTSFTAPDTGTALNLAGKLAGLDIAAALDLGETVGLVTTLSQPNLTALSGETAEFLAGGEFPIPLSQGLGSTSVEYKKYGVSLSYTPTVLANGRIALRVRPEVSELSSEGAVKISNFEIPALTVRRAETTVELGSGQSFMIAGLMRNNSQQSLDKTPGAGDIPILGALFRSTAYRRGETELVIVVTPYLVKPVDAADIKLPTDGYQAPNQIQQLLGNMDSDGVTGGSRPMPKHVRVPAGSAAAIGMLSPPAMPVPVPTTAPAPGVETSPSAIAAASSPEPAVASADTPPASPLARLFAPAANPALAAVPAQAAAPAARERASAPVATAPAEERIGRPLPASATARAASPAKPSPSAPSPSAPPPTAPHVASLVPESRRPTPVAAGSSPEISGR